MPLAAAVARDPSRVCVSEPCAAPSLLARCGLTAPPTAAECQRGCQGSSRVPAVLLVARQLQQRSADGAVALLWGGRRSGVRRLGYGEGRLRSAGGVVGGCAWTGTDQRGTARRFCRPFAAFR